MDNISPNTEVTGRKKKLRKKKSTPKLTNETEKPTLKAWWAVGEKDPEENTEDLGSILLKFVTKQPQYAVSHAPISVKENSSVEVLNDVIRKLLNNDGVEEEIPVFEFMIGGKLLVHSLASHLTEAEISFESTVEVNYFERHPPPTPKDNLEHDDWVSSVMSCGDWLVTGCYDNTVQLWSIDSDATGLGKRAHKLTIPAHHAPVKAVTWINNPAETDLNKKTFVSCSIDQSAIVWDWNSKTNSVDRLWECRGHTQSVECVAVEQNGPRFATGSWDNSIKIWDSDSNVNDLQTKTDTQPEAKKLKSKIIKTPIMTLAGHSESVSSLDWISDTQLVSGSWDHSLRLWDLEMGGKVSQINSNVAFFSISYSMKNRLLLGSCADRHIRLYDIRAKEGSIVLNKYTSHMKWISSVMWSSHDENLFVSGSYDNVIRVWDRRSAKASLYSMKGHEDKVLSVDWSSPSHIASGSADCSAQIYSVQA